MRKFLNTSRTSSSFTLIELIITVAIAASLIVASVTSFRSYTRNNLALQVARLLVADLNYARNYALSTKQTISVCSSVDIANATTITCTNGGLINWKSGWIVYIGDPTVGNSAMGTQFTPSSTLILKTNQNLNPVSITSSTGGTPTVRRVTFSDRGVPTIYTGTTAGDITTFMTLSDTPSVIFMIKPTGCTGNNGRTISINRSGILTLSAVAC